MSISIKKMNDKTSLETIKMITDLFNYHRQLTNSTLDQTNNNSKILLNKWCKIGIVYNIFFDDKNVGFFYVRIEDNNAWLEDLFILEAYRGRGIGKKALKVLDEEMIKGNIKSMYVYVIPKNVRAMKLYKECGFDHLNMIELCKHYDKNLNRSNSISISGFDFKTV